MFEILQVIAPVFLLIGLGYVCIRSGYVDKATLPVLGALVVRISLPVLIFKSLSQRSLDEVFNLRYLAAYSFASLLALSIGFLLVGRKKPFEVAAIRGMGMSCSNSAFLGFPIAMQLVGSIASLALALTMMVENLLMLPLCLGLAEFGRARGDRHFWAAFLHVLRDLRKNPILIAIAFGVLFALLGISLPRAAVKAIDLLSATSAPLALFVIGGTLVDLRLRDMIADAALVGTGKLFLHPLLALAAYLLLAPIDPALSTAAVLIAAMPMMSIFPILGQKYGQEAFCAATLLLTTVASFFTVSIAIWLLHAYQPFGSVAFR